MLFLRGLLIPVGSDRVPLPRKGRRPVEKKSWTKQVPYIPGMMSLWQWMHQQVTRGNSLSCQDGEGEKVRAAPL